jgi:hypothetical protein
VNNCREYKTIFAPSERRVVPVGGSPKISVLEAVFSQNMLLRSAKENEAAGDPVTPALKTPHAPANSINRIARALCSYSFFQYFGKGIVGAEAKAFDCCNDAPYYILALFN